MQDAVPPHIQPPSIRDMSSDQIEALLTAVRDRRLHAARIHAETVAAAKLVADERTRDSLNKQLDMLAASIANVEKAAAKMEARLNKVRALRLELGID